MTVLLVRCGVISSTAQAERNKCSVTEMATACKSKGEGIRLTRRCSTRKAMADPDPESVVLFCVRVSQP